MPRELNCNRRSPKIPKRASPKAIRSYLRRLTDTKNGFNFGRRGPCSMPRSIRSRLHRLGERSQRGRDWFTPYSLAEALHVRVDEVQKWVNHGWLKCRVVETANVKKRIIDPDDFSDFAKQHGRAEVGRRLNADGPATTSTPCPLPRLP